MKVVKKVRLLTKDSKGLFIKNDTYEVLRDKATVLPSSVEDTNKHYAETGIYYIVDEEATSKRVKESKPKQKRTVKKQDVKDEN